MRNSPKIVEDTRNLRLGISADGVNVNTGNRHHSVWPVFTVIYNLPPWLCMKRKFINLSVLISRYPRNDIDVFLHTLFETGVDTYDASTKDNFNLCAVVLWIINDYPALGTLCGCPYSGFKGCVVCGKDTNYVRLSALSKQSYVGHKGYLPYNRLFKKQKKAFNGQPVFLSALIPMTGEQIYNENVAESLVGTLLHVPGKTKDGVNARLDLAELGVKPELFAMQEEDKTTLTIAGYTLTNAEKDTFCETLHNIRVPQENIVVNLDSSSDNNNSDSYSTSQISTSEEIDYDSPEPPKSLLKWYHYLSDEYKDNGRFWGSKSGCNESDVKPSWKDIEKAKACMLAKAQASEASSKAKVEACGSKAKLQASTKTLIVKSPGRGSLEVDKIIDISSDSSDDRRWAAKKASAPVFYGPSTQGLLDAYGCDIIKEYLEWNYFPRTDNESTNMETRDKGNTDKDCIDDSNSVMSKGTDKAKIIRETVKAGQTRTREKEEHTRAGRMISKRLKDVDVIEDSKVGIHSLGSTQHTTHKRITPQLLSSSINISDASLTFII
ncbi:retrovirus-related pol polyprotein from transposon TNT 1-94 [Tanacetum coccineum]